MRIFFYLALFIGLSACQTTGNSHSNKRFTTELDPVLISSGVTSSYLLEKSIREGHFQAYKESILATLEEKRSSFPSPGMAVAYLYNFNIISGERDSGEFARGFDGKSNGRFMSPKRKQIMKKIEDSVKNMSEEDSVKNMSEEDIVIISNCFARDNWNLLSEKQRAVMDKMAMGVEITSVELKQLDKKIKVVRNESFRIKCVLEPYGLYEEVLTAL